MQRRSGSAPPTSPLRWDMACSNNTSFFEAAIQAHVQKRAYTPPPHYLTPSYKPRLDASPRSNVSTPRRPASKNTYANMVAQTPSRQQQDMKRRTQSPHSSSPQGPKGVPQACVFVASLSSQRTDKQLHESVTRHFKKWGKLLDVKVLKDWRNRPYSFVQYENIQDARKALKEAHGNILDGREIRVEQARVNRTLFISNFPLNFTKKDVQVVLEKYGPIEHLNMIHQAKVAETDQADVDEQVDELDKLIDTLPQQVQNGFGVSRPSAFAKFCYRDDAIKAYLELRSVQKWTADWQSRAVGFEKTHTESEVDATTIFIGQLNQQLVTETLLKDAFGVFGHIVSCQLIVRPSRYGGEKPAFAFIQYQSPDSADKAITEMNGKIWLNRVLRVQNRELGSTPDSPAPTKLPTSAGIESITGTPSSIERSDNTTGPNTPSGAHLAGVMFASPSSPSCLSHYADSEMTLSPAPTTLVDPSCTRTSTPTAGECNKDAMNSQASSAPNLHYGYPAVYSPMVPHSPYGMPMPVTPPPHYYSQGKDRRFPHYPEFHYSPMMRSVDHDTVAPPMYYSYYPMMMQGPHGYPYYPYGGYPPYPYAMPHEAHYYNGNAYSQGYGTTPDNVVIPESTPDASVHPSPATQL